MENYDIHPLNKCHVHKLRALFNRTHTFLHSLALTFIFYYRANYFFNKTDVRYDMVPFIPWLVIFGAELMLTFIWALRQPFYWRPVTRTVFTENLPKDSDLPGIDVFICTADPNKEPTVSVMNTVVSAMSLDYPAQKLNVYLSDDAGASVTLYGLKQAYVFATWWLPFCRRYDVKPPCPEAYFQSPEDEYSRDEKFVEDRKVVLEKYEIFKQRVMNRRDSSGDAKQSSRDHPALVQVIDGSNVGDDTSSLNPEPVEMPLLVYVAREKRPSYPHNFKAGALNVLQRVSSILSNSPYILILDCDMYCNDSISARQAMCFFLDSAMSSSLGWLQYPQKFHNVCENDIYDSQFRLVWTVYWPGADGLHGPVITGTNFYIQRKALYGVDDIGNDVKEMRESLGLSNELIKSVGGNDMPKSEKCKEYLSDTLNEAHLLASCIFEKDTKWGKQVGFWYDTVVEDVKTGSYLHYKGWKSVYMNPERPQFLGSATTNFDDMFTQGTRWYSGFVDVVLSKHYPLIYSPSKLKFYQKMLSSYYFSEPFYALPVLCFAIVSPLCFIFGVPLYPRVSDPFFKAFAYALLSSWVRHIIDVVIISGASVNVWLHEQRVWIIRSMTSFLFGTLECIITRFGVREASFNTTNKAGDDDRTKWYQMGKYDFRTSEMMILPLVTTVTLNVFCLVIGVAFLVVARDPSSMFVHMVLSFYALMLSLPVIEGMLLRTDSGRVPLSTTLKSVCLSLVLLSLGYVFLVL
ncbi:hypothetical protein RND81_12G127300 [Saponaria officinalis]|uniref:Uncharacterized protein n=1 Tax=Saponaria officinalis TaxID=3572 RepID=A0AAW1H9Y3_SAPOF